MATAFAVALAIAGCGGGDDSEDTAAARAGDSTSARTGATAPAAPDGPNAPSAPAPSSSQLPEADLPPEAQIDLAIKGVLASAAPELACERYATERYVETTFGSRDGCIQSTVPASAAHSVEVTLVRIGGRDASAVAVPRGGPSGGERIVVELVFEGGVWKVDSLRSNVPVGP